MRAAGLRALPMSSEGLTLLRRVCADVRRCPDTDGPLWSESWAALNYLCPDALAGATEILDKKTITCVLARESRREYFMVDSGKSKKSHTCLPGFCSCMAYCLKTAAKPDALVCKHELAVLLAAPLGKLQHRELEDDEWAKMFNHAVTMPMNEYDPHMHTSPDKTSAHPMLM